MKKQVVQIILSLIVGGIVGFCLALTGKKHNQQDKSGTYMNILDNWLLIKSLGGSLETYFEDNGIHQIAIYGYGKLGQHLYRELKNSNIKVLYIIDKNKAGLQHSISVYEPTEQLPHVDAIVITPVMEMSSIKDMLSKQHSGKIVSIEEVVYECL